MVKNPRLHLQIFPNKPIHWFKSIMDGLNPVDSENKLIHGEIPLTKKLRIVHASHRFPLLKIWQHPLHWWFFPFPPGIMKFCPSSLAKLVQISPIKPMVYGRYNELVFMGFINPRSHHWGHHPVVSSFCPRSAVARSKMLAFVTGSSVAIPVGPSVRRLVAENMPRWPWNTGRIRIQIWR